MTDKICNLCETVSATKVSKCCSENLCEKCYGKYVGYYGCAVLKCTCKCCENMKDWCKFCVDISYPYECRHEILSVGDTRNIVKVLDLKFDFLN